MSPVPNWKRQVGAIFQTDTVRVYGVDTAGINEKTAVNSNEIVGEELLQHCQRVTDMTATVFADNIGVNMVGFRIENRGGQNIVVLLFGALEFDWSFRGGSHVRSSFIMYNGMAV